ncbi:MAG: AMP-binding protein, partial [Caldilineaceae bacterium]|nr:AMP-binding protein [Caldilineaceae bacterium]
MLWELRRLRRRATWSRPQLEAHQHKRCAQLRTRAYAESRFYQDFHAGYADAPLHELPVLTKAMMREHFDEIVTDASITKEKLDQYTPTMHPDDWLHDRYVVATTAGTTGAPAHMLYARAEWATALASFARFEDHVGSLWGAWQRPKMAVVASNTPWHISARMGATVRSSWLPMLRLDIGQPLSQIVAELNAWQPYLLATYASMAGVLAEEQRAGRLHIAPRRIVTAAEVLSPALRQRVQSVWGDIVFGQYGATEGGIFAAECPAHGIVAHEDGARDSAGATSCRQTGGLH